VSVEDAIEEGDREVGYQRLRDAIRLGIVEGTHPAGSRLKIPALCATYTTSAIPVREALQALQGEGLVIMEPHRGAIVRAVDADFVRQIYEIREAVEGYLAGRFVALAPFDALVAMREAQAHMEAVEAAGDLVARHAADREFHRIMLKAAGNEQALALIERHNALSNALRLKYGQSDARRAQVREEHHALLAALEARDATAAVEIAARHTRHAYHDFIFRMRADPRRSQR
jgi:DNA-binding GntR family transcriptional regulator